MEQSSDDVSRSSEETPMVIDPLAQRQAQVFLLKTYAFIGKPQKIREAIEGSVLPEELKLERFDDLEAFMTAVERLAGVPSLQELGRKYLALKTTPGALAAYLYGLQHRGQLPRWVVPLFNNPVLNPGFEDELRRRLIAAR